MGNERLRDPAAGDSEAGNRTPSLRPRVITPAQFWARVDKSRDCWTIGSKRYTQVLIRDGVWQQAHRYSYEQHFGPIAAGLVIDHKCRNPRCVRLEHLEAVTQSENVRRWWQSKSKSRTARSQSLATTLIFNSKTLRAALERIARDDDRSLNFVINQACEELIERRQAFRKKEE